MGLSTRASDWKALGITQTGFGLLVAGGIFVFDFYSAAAGLCARYTLTATGTGLGGNLSGFGDPAGWSDIECSGTDTYGQPFSAYDLDKCPGHIGSAGAASGVGYGFVYISAGPKPGFPQYLFAVQSVGGFGIGVGASAFSLTGTWRFKRVSNNRPDEEWAA
jgi:hypothetical protein